MEKLAKHIPDEHGAVEITGLSADSRKIGPGMLFAAIPGLSVDGRDFIPAALAAGAAALLVPADTAFDTDPGVPVIRTANVRRALSQMAARFHGAQPETIVAVTGTNGKTSVAGFARQMFEMRGHSAAAIGTLGISAPAARPDLGRDEGLTTPDPVALHGDLAHLAHEGVSHLAIEASSHGLDQDRLDGLAIRAAAFTNLTRDHLDYHGSMEAYEAAKLRLFSELLPAGGVAVLNADMEPFARINRACTARGLKIIDYGVNAEALKLVSVMPDATGQRIELAWNGETVRAHMPLVGAFQAGNALAALGLWLATTDETPDADVITGLLEGLKGAPGRMAHVGTHSTGAPVFVDYAHTPDALETVLVALRPHCEGRLICVFGCGGDRDAGKRPLMGAISAQFADVSIVTDDNPRNEDPGPIRAAIMAACPGGIEIGDRRKAIAHAVTMLEKGDLLLIAGKGHEQGQLIKGVNHPFDDAQEARAVLARSDNEGLRR